MTNFSSLGVSEGLVKGLKEMGIHKPSEIQAKAIPLLLDEAIDFVGQAQTGTGKTAAYGLPMLQRLNTQKAEVQALVLAPTRELCQQIARQLFKFTKYTEKTFVEAVYGGADMTVQIQRLKRPTHVIVATPGRLMDLIRKQVVDLSRVRTVILDEGDEMLSIGFKEDIHQIFDHVSHEKNVWLFSATMPEGIKEIIRKFLKKGTGRVQISHNAGINANVSHEFITCRSSDKLQDLLHFLSYHKKERGMIFCQTKQAARSLARQLQTKNLPVEAIEGDMGQRDRDKVMRKFKSKKLDLLIATDIAARGIDVKGLSFVLHYQLPQRADYYTHRSGRTGRAGMKGNSILFITERERSKAFEMAGELKVKLKPLN